MSISHNLLTERVLTSLQLATESSNTAATNILKHVSQHLDKAQYTVVDLLEASGTENLNDLMDAVFFLSSKPVKLFSLQFLYFPLDNSKAIEVSADAYFAAKLHNTTPTDLAGNEFVDFNPKRLGFSCHIHNDLIV
ncbi:hypothetical protein OTK49_00505 [Vibrio coralliirubri]|uniref:hypothetical protein n=1 Tax=Vibrio coralliirubri TaxID=1516159 RepID=UPI00228455E9|nr:hypothetical protein [Vibrio coralliirubri]MCY9861022.1 hypothetical protein [Vibrio coralliirubri]